MATETAPILVTGGTGFIGGHLILQLLQQGHTVRTTVRSLAREGAVRKSLVDAGADAAADVGKLAFVAADLNSDDGWAAAVAGCACVHHVASPFPLALPKHEDELIIPAREGTLRVLRAARDAKVRRVVLTSSFAAIGYGYANRTTVFTEEDWSIIDGSQGQTVPPYQKSKTIAERAAWDFIKSEGGELELVVVNPVGVFGPVIGNDVGTSNQVVKKMLDGSVPGCPQMTMGAVDVRDIADLHIRAMNNPKAKGERFLGVDDSRAVSFLDIAKIIREKRPDHAKKVPTMELPNWLMKVVAIFDPSVRQIIPELGRVLDISNEKAKRVLGWTPRSTEESILATVDSLVQRGLV
jgi:dihydroflavonol-4-reductase